MHFRLAVVAVILYGLTVAIASAEERLCPSSPSLPPDVDDHRMTEDQFTLEHFQSSLSYFQNDLAKELVKTKRTEDVINKEAFWITYENSLRFIEGYALKQAALLERTQVTPGSTAKKWRGPAVQRFCEFVSKAQYLD